MSNTNHSFETGTDGNSSRRERPTARSRRWSLLFAVLLGLVALIFWAPWHQPVPQGPSGAALLDYVTVVTAPGIPDDEPLPMVVAFHGLGGSADRFLPAYADLGFPARLVVPNAPEPYVVGRAWFPVENDPEFLAELDRTVERVAALLEHLPTRWPTRGKPIVSGFSQGGILSFSLAAKHPELLSAAVPVAGGLPYASVEDLPLDPTLPIRAFHGEADGRISVRWGRWSVETLRQEGADVTLETFPELGHKFESPMRERVFETLRELAEAEP